MPMSYREFNAFCAALPATTHVVQWGGAHVWKVGGKVFAIGGWQRGSYRHHLQVSDIGWEMLRDAPGCRPALYLASRGMKWIQNHEPGLGKRELKQYLKASHALVAAQAKRSAPSWGLLNDGEWPRIAHHPSVHRQTLTPPAASRSSFRRSPPRRSAPATRGTARRGARRRC